MLRMGRIYLRSFRLGASRRRSRHLRTNGTCFQLCYKRVQWRNPISNLLRVVVLQLVAGRLPTGPQFNLVTHLKLELEISICLVSLLLFSELDFSWFCAWARHRIQEQPETEGQKARRKLKRQSASLPRSAH